MPFWWTRRKRFWYGRRRPFYKRRKRTYKRRRRRPFYKNRYKRTHRRYRKRRKKVRRKLKKIPVQQWQPERIVKCKIKGIDVVVLGAQGKQWVCYTDDAQDWVPSKAPGGGGFGVEVFTLRYLYDQNRAGNNIWTRSNVMTDLCRYTGCKIRFFRHQYTDFIVNYKISPPFNFEKDTYAKTHPQSLLLGRHRVIVPSRLTKPQGKPYVTIKIRPPKLMVTKWFFQETFSKYPLVQISAAACNLSYAHLSPIATNQLSSLWAINLQFYVRGDWGNSSPSTPGKHYNPTGNMKNTFTGQLKEGGTTVTITVKQDTYNDTISYANGWFQPKLLQAIHLNDQTVLPTSVLRYNPTVDDGKGNAIWFKSILTESYQRPSKDNDLIITDMPLWQLVYGFANYVTKKKGDINFLKSYVMLISSKSIFPFGGQGTNNFHLPIDRSFIEGKGPYSDYVTTTKKSKWFPTLEHQQEAINAICCSGPWIPKYANITNSTWELHAMYTFFFKWGGTLLPDQPVADPTTQATYDVPDKIQQALQIINPEKQKAAQMLHCWDYRRGFITNSAIKRMYEDQPTDTDFQTDSESYSEPPQKKAKGKALQTEKEEDKEIQACLLSLYEEPTCQELPQDQEVLQLINQQQIQQQQIKLDLLKLISDLKRKQQLIQLQTGLLD